MKDLQGKVAVVTGAASGIGRALVDRFASEGMKIVAADLHGERVRSVVSELKAAGAEAIAIPTDVSKAADVEALAQATREAFGVVHVVCNNAGVAARAVPTWKQTIADWESVLGVNLWGVIHGLRAFVPILLEQGIEAHVVNTASLAGLISVPFGTPYNASKHAVVTISESLHHELAIYGARVKVSVLCPGFVRTAIADSIGRHPDASSMTAPDPEEQQWTQALQHLVAAGKETSVVADLVVDAIRADRFYVLSHPELKGAVKNRMRNILEDTNPVFEGL